MHSTLEKLDIPITNILHYLSLIITISLPWDHRGPHLHLGHYQLPKKSQKQFQNNCKRVTLDIKPVMLSFFTPFEEEVDKHTLKPYLASVNHNVIIETSREGLCQGCICVLSISWFRTILYHSLCHSAIPPFRHSTIPPFCHSAIPPLRHSAIPSFRHSTIPPFRHSTILPFCHSAIPPFRHSAIPPFRPNMQ